MENRRLNFSAPLLSTRRSSIGRHSSQEFKPNFSSDSHLDQVTKPAAIPFKWEHIPGIPKHSAKPRSRSCELPSTNPRRMIDILKHRVDKTSAAAEAYRGGKVHPANEEDDKSEANVSLSIICSASAASNHDVVPAKPSGTISSDFMMSRFLPAAQALALQPFLSSSRKLPSHLSREENLVSLHSKRSALPTEDSSNDDESCVSHPATKSCVYFPRLCFKGSLEILTPPATKSRPPTPAKKANSQAIKQEETTGKVNQLNFVNERSSMSRSSSPLRRSGNLSISPLKRTGTGTASQEIITPNKVPYYRNGVQSQEFSSHYMRQRSCTFVPAIQKFSFEKDEFSRTIAGYGGFRGLPVPSMPSDSWLGRTLPSLPTSSNAINGVPSKVVHDDEAKWERIVKASYPRGDRIRYSAELVRYH